MAFAYRVKYVIVWNRKIKAKRLKMSKNVMKTFEMEENDQKSLKSRENFEFQ